MRILNYIFYIIFIISCSPATLIVKNVQDITEYGDHSFVYSLPRTRIAVHITAIREYTVPGKYCQYAEKYLGITDVPSNPVTNWEIKNIEITPFGEPDPEYFFSIETENTDYLLKKILELKEEGFILKVDDTNPFLHYFPVVSGMQKQMNISGYSTVEKNSSLNISENFKNKRVIVPIDLPVGVSKAGIKTEEQKIQQAANFIFKIRKRRIKLVAGQADSLGNGSSLETSIRELNRLEQEYLSLFIGKTITDTIKQVYSYVPGQGSDADRSVICRFSDITGFSDGTSNEGKPLIMELTDHQQTSSLDHMVMPALVKNNGCILYRIPDMATVHVYYGSVPVVEGEVKVYQYGTILPYCVNLKKE
jgi:hypothetical protein